LQESSIEDDLDSVYCARVFEMDLDPRHIDKDALHNRHPVDRYEGEPVANFTDGGETFGGSDMSMSEDWLGAEIDLLQGEGLWER
jgi:hypothetical protein